VTATAAGATGVRVPRADSAFYRHDVIAAVRRQRACFSITARLDSAVRTAIAAIGDDAWTPIKHPNAVYDEAQHVDLRCRGRRDRPHRVHLQGQGEARVGEADRASRPRPEPGPPERAVHRLPLPAVFTDNPLPMLQADTAHRGHAIVEHVIADLKNGPLAHLPSGHFWANSAWLVCAAMAFNRTRAAGTLASAFHARATTGTIRAQLINGPARIARSARRLTLHLPAAWPWEHHWQRLVAGTGPPLTT